MSLASGTVILLTGAALAAIRLPVDAPEDAMSVRHLVSQNPEVQKLRSEYTAYTGRLRHITVEDIHDLLGEPNTGRANDLVLPAFAPNYAYVTGATAHSRQIESYAIGSSAVLKVYVGSNGTSINRAMLYFRRDSDFVPLLSETDLVGRLEWDKQRLQEIKTNLPLITLHNLVQKYLPHKKSAADPGQQLPAGDVLTSAPEE